MRVGAICGGNEKLVRMFGYGEHLGDLVPDVPADSLGMAPFMMEAGAKNPAIKLDSGKIVYGCECW